MKWKKIWLVALVSLVIIFTSGCELIDKKKLLVDLFQFGVSSTQGFYNFLNQNHYQVSDIEEFKSSKTQYGFKLKDTLSFRSRIEGNKSVTIINSPKNKNSLVDLQNLSAYSLSDDANKEMVKIMIEKAFESQKNEIIKFPDDDLSGYITINKTKITVKMIVTYY